METGPKRGLIMTGGGARAAYQIGVLKAVAEMLPKGGPSPFQIICGTSAGAINAVSLATMADNYNHAVAQLLRVWGNFRVSQVFYSDAKSIALIAWHWLLALGLGGLAKRRPLALLDRKPLRELLQQRIEFDRIPKLIDQGILHAVSLTASGYTSGQSVTFYEGVDRITPWSRARRCGCRCSIGINHLMASSAIPFLFEAVKVNREFFGDGSMREVAPLSAALHLGADRLLVIGNQRDDETIHDRNRDNEYPSLAQIAGHILDSIFLDSLESDLERLERINKTIDIIPSRRLRKTESPLRKVSAYVIAPSINLGELAQEYMYELPRTLRYMLKGIGAMRRHGSGLTSYLLFEKGYCRQLIRLGYEDAMQEQDKLTEFLRD
ncbi:MAG: patatin-like phospholipase family protein [Gammaproteobacteria bacterium]|nr:patatin-like phospholipase family protein [Gammaproteobacteria bacterium]